MEIKYFKSATRLLYRNNVNKGDLVLWIPIGQREAEVQTIKFGGLKKNSAAWPDAGESGSNLADRQFFFPNSNFDCW